MSAGEGGTVAIRRMRAGEGLRFRAIRVRALTEAPTAFGSTLDELRARPDAWWQRRAATNAAGEAAVMFVAERDGAWLGLAGGLFEEEAPGEAELISMWLDPAVRGRGVGARLVDAVVQWARERGAARLRLWVTEGNEPAVALYRRSGFAFTGERSPHPWHAQLHEAAMLRDLAERDCGG